MQLASCCLVIDRNKILLTLQKDRGWEPPGGFLEQDETFESAAVRECVEETGYVPSAPSLCGMFVKDNEPRVTTAFFVSRSSELVSNTFEESIEIRWQRLTSLNLITHQSTMMRTSTALRAAKEGTIAFATYNTAPYSTLTQAWV